MLKSGCLNYFNVCLWKPTPNIFLKGRSECGGYFHFGFINGTPTIKAADFVARGECSAGVVYATDAMLSDEVEIVTTLPDNLHDPIRYSVAIIANTEAYNVRTVMDRLLSPVATEIFNSHGFIVLEREEKDAESFVE